MELHQLFAEITSKLGETPPSSSPINGQEFARWGKNKRFWALIGIGNMGSPYAIFGDWTTGDRWYWSKKQGTTDKPDKETRALEKAYKQERERRTRTSQQMIERLVEEVLRCNSDTSGNPYAQRKGIPLHPDIRIAHGLTYERMVEDRSTHTLKPDGLNTIPDGSLCIVLRTKNGKACGVQYITNNSSKLFVKGSIIKGSSLSFGDSSSASYYYIAEGVGTAAAVWNAVNYNPKACVVCAFNCSNMKDLAYIIRDHYPASKIILCQDNDDAGRKACQSIASSMHDCIIKSPAKEGEDFADIPKRIAEKILEIKEGDFIEIISIGMDSKRYVFYSTYKKEKTECGLSIGRTHIEDIAPEEHWAKSFSRADGKGIDWRRCASYLKKISRKQGTIDETKLRGSGYFMTNPKSKDFRLYAQSEGITYLEIDKHKLHLRGKKIHVPNKPTTTENKKCEELIQSLVATSDKFCWTNDNFGRLLIGWLLTAPFCGCLPFRPHMWVTGNSSSGKSWIITNIAKPLLGDNAYTITGDTTEAGIRSALKHDAAPVIIDEFESEDKMEAKKRHRTLELLRQTSSEIDATIFKGSPDGGVKTFKICTSALLASVRSALTFEANRNRFLTLSLDARKQRTQDFDLISDEVKEEDLEFIRRANINKMFFNFKEYQEFYKFWYKDLRGELNEHLVRCYSVVCAALNFYHIGVERRAILNMAKGELEASRTEEENCFHHLLGYELTYKGEKRGSALELITELIEQGMDRDYEARHEEINSTLRSNGLNVCPTKWSLQIFYKHPKLCKIMSEYPDSNWYKTIKNLKDAKRRRTTLYSRGDYKLQGYCIEVENFLQNYSEV